MERVWSRLQIKDWLTKNEKLPQTLSLGEAREKYPETRFYMRITAFDFRHYPSHGYVIAGSPDEFKRFLEMFDHCPYLTLIPEDGNVPEPKRKMRHALGLRALLSLPRELREGR